MTDRRARSWIQFSRRWSIAALAMGVSVSLQATQFVQGPEAIGRQFELSATVIGIRNEHERRCHVLRVDKPDWPQGMGAGGRAVLCSKTLKLEMGQHWTGQAVQIDTARVKMGSRWRVVPLLNPI